MSAQITVPTVGESINEAVVSAWLANEGDFVKQDAPVVVLETDKANVEVAAPVSGRIASIERRVGDTVNVGEVIGTMEAGEAKDVPADGKPAASREAPAAKEAPSAKDAPAREAPAPKEAPSAKDAAVAKEASADKDAKPEASAGAAPAATVAPAPPSAEIRATPSARRLMKEAQVDASSVVPSGPAGRVTRHDVHAALTRGSDSARSAPPRDEARPAASTDAEQIIPMSPLRKRVAQRLVEAQQTAALLTTFNEVDMSAVMELRKRHGEAFMKKHGVKLGFMSFFVKAAVEALKSWPVLNAEVRGTDVVYRNAYHIGVAVGSERGLVVPVVRDADALSFAEVEKTIAELAAKARSAKLKIDDLQGGTFTITNGGIYGSMLSTPIVNPPQSGILGMHKIDERPVARGGQVVIRPMMFLAVTYDHRIIDGREAVSFLVQIRELLEDPSRILLEL